MSSEQLDLLIDTVQSMLATIREPGVVVQGFSYSHEFDDNRKIKTIKLVVDCSGADLET